MVETHQPESQEGQQHSSRGISVEHQHRLSNGPTRLSLGPFWNTLALSGTHTLNQTFTGWTWCNAGMLDTHATTSAAPCSSVTAMLQQIGWETLHERKAKSRLAMQYRIAHNLVDVIAANHLQTYNSRKCNATKFRVPYARTVAYKHSFFPDVTRMWNALMW